MFECKQCGKCCMVFEIGPVGEDKKGQYNTYQDPYFPEQFHLVKKNKTWAPVWAKQGVCSYLGEDLKCTIYNRRPDVCRGFTCRDSEGKLKKHYTRTRRRVGDVERWTGYEKEVFGPLLLESKKSPS